MRDAAVHAVSLGCRVFERFNWDSPIEVSFHQPTRIYHASYRVWRSDDRGDSWTPISGDLTRSQERIELPIMGRAQSWDAAWDVGAMSNYNTVTSIGESPLDENLIYAGTDDGLVQVTEDGGATWRELDTPTGERRMWTVFKVERQSKVDRMVFSSFSHLRLVRDVNESDQNITKRQGKCDRDQRRQQAPPGVRGRIPARQHGEDTESCEQDQSGLQPMWHWGRLARPPTHTPGPRSSILDSPTRKVTSLNCRGVGGRIEHRASNEGGESSSRSDTMCACQLSKTKHWCSTTALSATAILC